VAGLKVLSQYLPEATRKSMENLSQDRQSRGRDSNQEHTEFEARVPTIHRDISFIFSY
jgi:hypothetical protein